MTAVARPALVAALTLLASLGAASAQGQDRDRDRDYRRADPAAIVAAEIAFARLAQEKGQWTAVAEYATRDAVMFVPQTVNAQAWLKGRANPAQAVRWQPHQVWSSCDGSIAVTKGAWQRPDGSVGYFTTVWQRQQKQKDGFRWVLDQGEVPAEPLVRPELIKAMVADCGQTPDAYEAWDGEQADWEANAAAADATVGFGESADRTLTYRYRVLPSGARRTEVFLLKDGKMEQVLLSEVAAE